MAVVLDKAAKKIAAEIRHERARRNEIVRRLRKVATKFRRAGMKDTAADVRDCANRLYEAIRIRKPPVVSNG